MCCYVLLCTAMYCYVLLCTAMCCYVLLCTDKYCYVLTAMYYVLLRSMYYYVLCTAMYYTLSRNLTGEFDEYPSRIAGVQVGNRNLELVNTKCHHTCRATTCVVPSHVQCHHTCSATTCAVPSHVQCHYVRQHTDWQNLRSSVCEAWLVEATKRRGTKTATPTLRYEASALCVHEPSVYQK